jgi:hypothetical protein
MIRQSASRLRPAGPTERIPDDLGRQAAAHAPGGSMRIEDYRHLTLINAARAISAAEA